VSFNRIAWPMLMLCLPEVDFLNGEVGCGVGVS
jgi:hypothetical protein